MKGITLNQRAAFAASSAVVPLSDLYLKNLPAASASNYIIIRPRY